MVARRAGRSLFTFSDSAISRQKQANLLFPTIVAKCTFWCFCWHHWTSFPCAAVWIQGQNPAGFQNRFPKPCEFPHSGLIIAFSHRRPLIWDEHRPILKEGWHRRFLLLQTASSDGEPNCSEIFKCVTQEADVFTQCPIAWTKRLSTPRNDFQCHICVVQARLEMTPLITPKDNRVEQAISVLKQLVAIVGVQKRIHGHLNLHMGPGSTVAQF